MSVGPRQRIRLCRCSTSTALRDAINSLSGNDSCVKVEYVVSCVVVLLGRYFRYPSGIA